MTTLVTDVVVRKTENTNRQTLFEFRGVYPELSSQSLGKVELAQAESKTISSKKLLCAYFPKPTIIQITIDSVVSTVTVSGTILLPFECEMTVTNSSSSATDPTIFQYVTA